MTREQELHLIEEAIKNGKLTKITSEQYLNHFFQTMKESSEKSRTRIKRVNTFGVGKRSKAKEVI